ncbi:MAG: PaaI family thioesterase [Acidaminococcaceae bacterium]
MAKFISNTYQRNNFVKLCGVGIKEIHFGEAVLNIEIDDDKHTNLYGAAHGGVIGTLADTACGVVSASVGYRVVTLNLNINYIDSIYLMDEATAYAKIVHRGMSTLVIEVEIRNGKKDLMAKAMGTMFVVGRFEEIPERW